MSSIEEFSSRVSLDGLEVRAVPTNENLSIVKQVQVGVNVCSVEKMKFEGGAEVLLCVLSASHSGHVSCG
jgi:hypothetical protein